MGVGWGGGWPFFVFNIFCFLFSKVGLKGCVYGQVAGEVCGCLSALVGRGGGAFCLIHLCPCLS